MEALNRRRTLQLAVALGAAPLVKSAPGQAQPAPVTFDMADYARQGLDADAAFAAALSAVAKAAAAAKAGTRPAALALRLERGGTYRIKRPVKIEKLDSFTFDGNGAQLINTARGASLTITGSSRVAVRDLTIDYDPLPYTQGVITGFDGTATAVTVKIDPGYPDDPELLASFSDGFFKVMDRRTRSLKPGARDFLSPKSAERLGPGLIRVVLQWSANDTFPSQLKIANGDPVAICNSIADAVVVQDCSDTSFSDFKLLASPAMGILENGGPGGTRFERISIVPGPRPQGATTDRLVSTNSDGSHFTAVARGPVIEDCVYANTSDDAINVHGFYYYVVRKAGPARYLLSPKWDIGLEAGDVITACDSRDFHRLGQTKILELSKRPAPELKADIAKLWKGRSPTTQPDLVYDVRLEQDLPLKTADAISSLTHVGQGAQVRGSTFHACGRVLVKCPAAVVENCQFSYSYGPAVQAGSDIGFWSESGFAENLVVRNNRFSRCVVGANELTDGNNALGTIYVGMAQPLDSRGFEHNVQNRDVTISGNQIDDSFIYAIFVSNAAGVKITDNVIGQTFIRGAGFGAGGLYGIAPNSAIYIGMAQDAQISGNIAAQGRVTIQVVGVDRTCNRPSILVRNNRLA